MPYLVRHLTRFVYTSPITESVMEVRMQPLDRAGQRCLRFSMTTSPRAKLFAYRDHYGNAVHYFDVPGRHSRLDILVESAVEVAMDVTAPEALRASAWDEVDRLGDAVEHSEWLLPSGYTRPTDALAAFATAIGLNRDRDPMTTLRALNTTVFEQFAYEPQTTNVDSHIDDALRARAGVCQDFAHIMTALVRGLGIPARYVSGYIAHGQRADHDRSADNATHAWMEAFLPGAGWIGFDPTNDVLAGDRHIVVAVGRDYGDVPPTRGVFKGDAGSQLSVAVAVAPAGAPIAARELAPAVSWIVPARTGSQEMQEIQAQQ